MEPEVRRTTWVMVSIAFVVVAMAIGNIVWSGSVVDNLKRMAYGLWITGDRLLSLQATEWYFHGLLVINTTFAMYGPTESLIPGLTVETERLRADHEFLYLNGHELGTKAYEYEMTVLHRVVEISASGQINGEYFMPLTELGEYYASKLDRLMQIPVNDIHADLAEARNVVANRPACQDSMNETIKLREAEYAELEPQFQLQLIIVGSAFFVVTVIISSIFFVTAVRSLGRRTLNVLRTTLYVPSRVAKAMQKRSVALLNRLISTDAENEDGADNNDEAEMRLIIQEDDVDASLDKVMAALRRSGGGGGGASMLRPYTSRSTYVSRNMVRLLLPILLVLGWLVFLVAYQMEFMARADQSLRRMSLIQQMSTLLMEYTDTISHIVLRIGDRGENIVFCQQIDAQLLSLSRVAVFGGTVYNVHGVAFEVGTLEQGSTAHRFLIENACVGSDSALECAALARGVLTKGIYSALLAAVNLGHKVMSSVIEDGDLVDPGAINDFADMLHLEAPHLRSAMLRASVALREEGTGVMEDGLYVVTVVSIIFSVLFSFFTIFLYWPIISRLAAPLRSARSLLVLFPEELISRIPALRDAILDIATEVQLGGHARSHRRGTAAVGPEGGSTTDSTAGRPSFQDK